METVNARLASLERAQYEGAGRGSGLHAGWGYLVGAIGALCGLVGLFFALSK